MIADPAVSIASYAELRSRVLALLADVDDADAASTPVPACPGWTVTDVGAHLCGTCVDIIEGNLDGVTTAPWTASQVERFAPLGLAAILDRWDDAGPAIDAIGAAFPPDLGAQFAFDATTHEQDIRGALGRPGGREAPSLLISLGFVEQWLDGFVRSSGAPTLEVRSNAWSCVLGEGRPEVELDADTFELFRVFAGRRSVDQFRSLGWSAAPDPYLACFDGVPLTPRDDALVEPG